MNIKDVSKKYNVNFVHSTSKNNCTNPRSEELKQLNGKVDCIISKIRILVKLENIKDLSCSSIKSGDNEKCFFGPIGVILEDGIVTYAYPTDGGTYFDNGKLITIISTIPIDKQIDKAINHKTNIYNEFQINNPKVRGVYININDPRLHLEINNISNFIQNIFQFGLPIFAFKNGNFSEMDLNNTEITRE